MLTHEELSPARFLTKLFDLIGQISLLRDIGYDQEPKKSPAKIAGLFGLADPTREVITYSP
jgi:hypothetical protein